MPTNDTKKATNKSSSAPISTKSGKYMQQKYHPNRMIISLSLYLLNKEINNADKYKSSYF